MLNKKRFLYGFWCFKILAAVLVAAVLLQNLWEAISPPQRALPYYQAVKKDLSRSNFQGYSSAEVLLKDPFQIVALSDMAAGLMNLSKRNLVKRDELLPLIDEVKKRALSPYVNPYENLTTETDFTTGGTRGLYLSHLNLILGIHQHLHNSATPDPLHSRITEVLHKESLASSDFHVSSFQNGDKWPADQAVTLLSLYVYDQANQTHYSDEPIRGWFTFMNEHMIDKETGLYKASIAERWYKDIPRGNALSWTIFYMAQFAPKEAERVYATYRDKLWVEGMGIGGFREWPKGKPDRMTSDTGPVFAGFGTAATALGIGPTKLMHDDHHYTVIMRLFSLLGIPHYSPVIGKAILFSGETAVLWFSDYQPKKYDTQAQSAIVVYALYVLLSIAICSLILFFDVLMYRAMKKIMGAVLRKKRKTSGSVT
jgi:hypothetical protein